MHLDFQLIREIALLPAEHAGPHIAESGTHHGCERIAGIHDVGDAGIRVQEISVRISGVNIKGHIVGIDDSVLAQVLEDLAVRLIQIFFEFRQIVGDHAGRKYFAGLQIAVVRMHLPVFCGITGHETAELFPQAVAVIHQAVDINGLGADRQRIRGHGISLDI